MCLQVHIRNKIWLSMVFDTNVTTIFEIFNFRLNTYLQTQYLKCFQNLKFQTAILKPKTKSINETAAAAISPAKMKYSED